MPRSHGPIAECNSISKVSRFIHLVLAAYVSSHVSQQAYAQDICNLGERVVELLSTVDACAATGEQLSELELVRQQIVEPYAEVDCGELQERILELELTMPRRPAGQPANLDESVPICEAMHRGLGRGSVALAERLHE